MIICYYFQKQQTNLYVFIQNLVLLKIITELKKFTINHVKDNKYEIYSAPGVVNRIFRLPN